MGVFILNVAWSIVPPLRVVMECRTCHQFLELANYNPMVFDCKSCEKLAGAEKILAETTQPGVGPANTRDSSAILQQSDKNRQHQSYLSPKPDLNVPQRDPKTRKITSLDHFLSPTLHRPSIHRPLIESETTDTNQEKSRDD